LKARGHTFLSLFLVAICWLWLAMSFTATRQAWWNSLWVGLVLSGLGVYTGSRNVRSVFGLFALIPAILTFLLLLVLKFG